jgi:hypothetical protein
MLDSLIRRPEAHVSLIEQEETKSPNDNEDQDHQRRFWFMDLPHILRVHLRRPLEELVSSNSVCSLHLGLTRFVYVLDY